MSNVSIKTAGVEARNTDALECLLALCRVLGLQYEISEKGTPEYPYLIKVSWAGWPVDFFEPRSRSGSYSTCCKDPVEGLRSGIVSFVNSLQRNGEQFRSGFMQYWLKDTGRDWLVGKNDAA